MQAQGLEFSKHTQVMGAVHKHFVKAGRLNPEHGRNLNWLFELRALGDYGELQHVQPADAACAIDAAVDLVAALWLLCPDA